MMKAKESFMVLSIIINCRIHIGRCQNESCSDKRDIFFDGHELGFVNYKNNFIIGIDIIKEYLDLFSSSGISFVSWWNTRISTINDPERPLLHTSRNWKSYAGMFHEGFCLSAEKFKFSNENFICCKDPETILMDGIVVSIKTSNMPDLSTPWVLSTVKKRLTARKHRQFPKLGEPYISILESLLSDNGIANTTSTTLKTSNNPGIKCIGFCLERRGQRPHQKYFLKSKAKMFAKLLMKQVASIKSIVPNTCSDVIER